jgi:hypothetical protein
MQIEMRRPKAIGPKPAQKPVRGLKLFSEKHELHESVARRILSISSNGDQARSIAELMK